MNAEKFFFVFASLIFLCSETLPFCLFICFDFVLIHLFCIFFCYYTEEDFDPCVPFDDFGGDNNRRHDFQRSSRKYN